jgi:hypothetical protein
MASAPERARKTRGEKEQKGDGKTACERQIDHMENLRGGGKAGKGKSPGRKENERMEAARLGGNAARVAGASAGSASDQNAEPASAVADAELEEKTKIDAHAPSQGFRTRSR